MINPIVFSAILVAQTSALCQEISVVSLDEKKQPIREGTLSFESPNSSLYHLKKGQNDYIMWVKDTESDDTFLAFAANAENNAEHNRFLTIAANFGYDLRNKTQEEIKDLLNNKKVTFIPINNPLNWECTTTYHFCSILSITPALDSPRQTVPENEKLHSIKMFMTQNPGLSWEILEHMGYTPHEINAVAKGYIEDLSSDRIIQN